MSRGPPVNVLKSFRFRKRKLKKDFPFIAKLKVIPEKPYKKSKLKENRTEGNKGTRILEVSVIVSDIRIIIIIYDLYTANTKPIIKNFKETFEKLQDILNGKKLNGQIK